MVRISERTALAVTETAKGEAARVRMQGEAEAASVRAVGAAKAEAYEQGVKSMGADAFTAVQLANILASNHVKLVPDVSVSGADAGGGSGALAGMLMGRMVGGAKPTPVIPAVKNGHQ